jgi:hypothetical protein
MRGLGRLLALPWLLIALAVQSLAPAEAAAMRPDALAFGICSAHDLSGGSHRPDPAKGPDHDCCAFACALASLAAAPPRTIDYVPTPFDEPAGLSPDSRQDVALSRAVDRPRSRGPPSQILTT